MSIDFSKRMLGRLLVRNRDARHWRTLAGTQTCKAASRKIPAGDSGRTAQVGCGLDLLDRDDRAFELHAGCVVSPPSRASREDRCAEPLFHELVWGQTPSTSSTILGASAPVRTS